MYLRIPINDKTIYMKFINLLMRKGKQNLARKILFQTLYLIKIHYKNKKKPELIFKKAIFNCVPIVYYKMKKVSGISYNVPWHIKKEKALFLAMKWLIEASKNRNEISSTGCFYKTMAKRLSLELIDAANKKGTVIKKKQDLYKLILENRPFLKYIK